MTYEIRTIGDISEMDKGCPAEIGVYNWGGDYRPASRAVLCYVKNRGFAVRLTSREENPRAVQTEPNSAVCEDSCLEFFVNFAPELPGSGYLNFEGNAAGTMLCQCGGPLREPGAKRVPLTSLGCPHPRPRVIREKGLWGWELLIPLETIRAVYGAADFKAGSRIRGNFYKCGNLTGHPHYGSFTKIDLPEPNFHCPRFFADMIITG